MLQISVFERRKLDPSFPSPSINSTQNGAIHWTHNALLIAHRETIKTLHTQGMQLSIAHFFILVLSYLDKKLHIYFSATFRDEIILFLFVYVFGEWTFFCQTRIEQTYLKRFWEPSEVNEMDSMYVNHLMIAAAWDIDQWVDRYALGNERVKDGSVRYSEESSFDDI